MAEFITIVSGLPRSGTSLVMQMLETGGVPAETDDVRTADESNPRGYFEDERAKRLKTDNAWLLAASGKAVKVIAQLLPYLPLGPQYRVLLLERDLAEVLASQRKMLELDGRQGSTLAESQLAAVFYKQLVTARQWLDQRKIPWLPIEHRRLIHEPAMAVSEICQFLKLPLDEQAMIAVVDPTLYRNRGGTVG